MLIFSLCVLGLIIGSFLNVVIYRLPLIMLENDESVAASGRRLTLSWPRSHCPACKKTLSWYELIPVFSFLMRRCHCRYCRAPISWQYPIVEVCYAALMVLSYVYFGWSMTGLWVAVLNALLLVMWVIDFQQQLLFDVLTLSGMWLGLLFSAYSGFVSAQESIVAAACGYLLLRIVADAYRWCRKREGMGGGDMKLLALLGAWFGFHAFLILVVGTMLALVVSLILLLLRRVEWTQRIAFGPFLIISAWLWLFFIQFSDVTGILH